ncbi:MULTISPECIES: hypothetical protein [Levilactobacillus]|uniref:hypothetical protein n=1 Tax=Levilactobacillus TaxID=2767886 RepID=UPI001950F27F|nr:hypothetical protein [Levilactobacillus sp. 244-2]
MLKHKFTMDTMDPAEFKEHRERFSTLVSENPWLIPTVISLEIIPVTTMLHGFWKNRQLKKQLQIEREKTKQLQLGGGCQHGHCHGDKGGHCHHHPGGKPQMLADDAPEHAPMGHCHHHMG